MDEVFEEEERNLTSTLKEIDFKALSLEREADQIGSEISELFRTGNDYRSAIERRELSSRQKIRLDDANSLKQLASDPYFARLDFDVFESDLYKTKTYYIGMNGPFYDSRGQQLIVDWRSEIGQAYYQKTQRQFQVNEFEYQLLLRRALTIRQRKLLNCNTEYDAGSDISLEGEIVDPFLLEVLKDKRRHPRLTDIIRTIQENQNSILRRPLHECFALQGCAGSGKTMIMLHRLSYLKYNNPGMSLNAVKIITPNRQFSEQIRSLCNQLELRDIERLTVEEYYGRLIKQFHQESTPFTAIRSEKSLPEKMLERIYSPAFAQETADAYHSLWETELAKLKDTGIEAIAQRLKKDLFSATAHSDETYRLLTARLKAIREQADANLTQFRNAEEMLQQTQSELTSLYQQTDAGKNMLVLEKKQAIETIDSELSSARSRMDAMTGQQQALKSAVATAKEETSKQTLELNRLRSHLQSTLLIREKLTDYVQFRSMGSDTAILAHITAECHDLIQSIEDNHTELKKTGAMEEEKRKQYGRVKAASQAIFSALEQHRESYLDPEQIINLPEKDTIRGILFHNFSEEIQACISIRQQIEGIPSYNFLRRSRLNNNLQTACDQYRQHAGPLIETYCENLKKNVGSILFDLNACEQEVLRLRTHEDELLHAFETKAAGLISGFCANGNERIAELSGRIMQLEEQVQSQTDEERQLNADILKEDKLISALLKGRETLSDRGLPDFSTFKASDLGMLNPYVSDFIKKTNEYLDAMRKADRLEKAIPDLTLACDSLRDLQVNGAERALLDHCEEIAAGLSYANVFSRIEDTLLNKTYAEFGHKPNQYRYHHHIYLQLLYHSLYYRKPIIPDRYLCIDEAQDLSVSEYRLLKSILNKDCVYNLFGDVNQAVYSYKGIQDWTEDIPEITHGHVFLLNENYRNTIQVTDYCNKTFGTDMTAIGIGGDDVEELPLPEAIAWLADKKSRNSASRVCIIYRHGAEHIRQRIRDQLNGKLDFEYGVSGSGKVSFITVEMAKGLEFEYVLVAPDQMSDNEKYISFTRATEALAVITA